MVDKYLIGKDEDEPLFQKNFVEKVKKSWALWRKQYEMLELESKPQPEKY